MTANLDKLEKKSNQIAFNENMMEDSADVRAGAGEKVRLIEEGRAFFCSELVMKAFKCVGLIQSNEACTNWLPADLTSVKNRLNLVEGATLGPE